MTVPLPESHPALDVCASRLLSLTRTDLADPGIALHCLKSVDLLRTAGAQPVAIGIAPRPVAEVIRDVLAELGELPLEVFAHPSVTEAAAAARRALELAESAPPT